MGRHYVKSGPGLQDQVLVQFCACGQPARSNQRNCQECQRLAQRRHRARKIAELDLLRAQVGAEAASEIKKQVQAKQSAPDHPLNPERIVRSRDDWTKIS
jgi:hypothetical protein